MFLKKSAAHKNVFEVLFCMLVAKFLLLPSNLFKAILIVATHGMAASHIDKLCPGQPFDFSKDRIVELNLKNEE